MATSRTDRPVFKIFNWVAWSAVIGLVLYIVWSFIDPKENTNNYAYKGTHLGESVGGVIALGESIATAQTKLAGHYDAVDTLPYEGRNDGVFVFYNANLLGARGLLVLITDSQSNVSQVRFHTNSVQ